MPFGIVAIKLPPLKLAKLIRAHGQRQSREKEKGTVRGGEKERERQRERTLALIAATDMPPLALYLTPSSLSCLASPSLVLPFPDSLPSFSGVKKRKTLDKVFAVGA